MATGIGGNVPCNVIDSLLGQGWGYAEFETEVQRQGYTWSPGLKVKILGRELAYFKSEIQEKRREADIDEGSRSQSNSLESIRKRLKGKPWLQSQPTRDERDERLRTRRLLGKDVKIRSMQNYVKRWDQEVNAIQADSQFAGRQVTVSVPQANVDECVYSHNGLIPSSPRPSISHGHGTNLLGDGRSRHFAAGNTESGLLCSEPPSTLLHDAHSPFSSQMSFTVDTPPESLMPQPHATFDFFNTGSYPGFVHPLEVFSNPAPEVLREREGRLLTGWFEDGVTYADSRSAPGPLPSLDDESGFVTSSVENIFQHLSNMALAVATASVDYFRSSVSTHRPNPASSDYDEVDVTGQREQGSLDVAPAQETSPRGHRLAAAFGIADMAHDPHPPSDMNQCEEVHQNSDTDMLECSDFSDGSDDGELDCIQQQDLSKQHSEAATMIGPNLHLGKVQYRKCRERCRAKIKELRRQKGEAKRIYKAELSRMRSAFELLIRREAAKEAKIQELQETIQDLEISRQETAFMTYDQLTTRTGLLRRFLRRP